MRKLLILGSLVALLVPTASHAQFQLGMRLGFAPALGDYAQDIPMKDATMKSQIPLQLEGSYKVNRDFAMGAYFSYGFGQTDDAMLSSFAGANICSQSGIDCSANSMRLGFQGLYTFNQVKASMVPWAGVALGWEWANSEFSGPGGEGELSVNGFELGFQAGADYRVNPQFAIGPFVMLSVGQYGSGEVTFNGSTVASGDITDKGMHEWVTFGFRGTFDF